MLQKVKDDYYEGNYEGIIINLQDFIYTEEFKNFPENEQILLFYYLTLCYNHLGKSVESLELVQKAKKNYSHLASTDDYLSLIVSETESLITGGTVEEGIIKCKKALQSVDITTSTDTKKFWITLLTRNLAILLDMKGSLNESLELYKKSLVIGEKIISREALSSIYNNIGSVYVSKGEYDKALDYFYKDQEIMKEKNNDYLKGITFVNIGEVHYFKGNYAEALNYLQEGMKKIEKYADEVFMMDPLLFTVRCNVELENYEEVERIIEKLEKLNQEKKSTITDYYSKLAKAIYLMNNDRIKSKLEALPLFEALINHKFEDEQYKILIIVSICEINFMLLKSYNDTDLLNETFQIVNDRYDTAQTKGSYNEIVQMLFLKSKLLLLNSEYDKAEKCLYQALLSAEDHGLDLLKQKIEEDSIKLKNEAQKWKNAYLNNFNYTKKLEMLEVESYFRDIKKLIGN